jgi:general secretion pathway protein M
MIAALNEKQQRWLAIAILVAFCAAVLSVTALPLWSANAAQQAKIDQMQDQLQRFHQVADMDGGLRPEFERLKQSLLSDGHYLQSDTVAVAGAELQRIIKNVSAANQAQVLSTQILPVGKEQGFIRVAIKVRLRGTFPSILHSFYDLETNDVFLFLDKVSLRESAGQLRSTQFQAKQTDANFDLIAYMPDL